MSTGSLIPSARRLMSSLRDIGYDAESAIADLVDNSIDADARAIDVDLIHDGEFSFVRVSDDGAGMTEGGIEEAMRYGSSRAYEDDDLGRFGLGLKTASLSQCRCLTVASRTTPRGPIRIRRWDMDLVEETDAWIVERPRAREVAPELLEPLRARPGTVVMWEDLDRILSYAHPNGHHAQAYVESLAGSLSSHLEMVFHRFLAGERRPRVRIVVNGCELKPWDPFARDEPLTQSLPLQRLTLRHEGRAHRVMVRPYVLPAQHHFSSAEAHERASGPQRWNRQQGLYIYRRDRLIQAGGWSRLRTLDEHSKLARIALNIPPGAEEAFRVNVAKIHVAIPEQLRGPLRTLLAGVVSHAQDVYRQRVRLVPGTGEPSRSAAADRTEAPAKNMGDIWTEVERILRGQLRDQPDLLDRVLVELANAPPVADSAVG